jgi:hypothetical protein
LVTGLDQVDIKRMRDQLFFDGPQRRRRLSRFWLLLLLAAVIASAGVVSDSTATVIGAMIVAPLMTPILGIVLAVALADGAQPAPVPAAGHHRRRRRGGGGLTAGPVRPLPRSRANQRPGGRPGHSPARRPNVVILNPPTAWRPLGGRMQILRVFLGYCCTAAVHGEEVFEKQSGRLDLNPRPLDPQSRTARLAQSD